MRIKRPLLVIAFLMFLYIGPMIFITSYGGVAIPAQPNMNKDFILSSGTIELADYGEDQDEIYDPNYVKTHVLDNDAFEEVGIDIEIWFELDGENIGYFNYSNYLYATSQDDCNIGIWNFDVSSFDNFGEPLPTSYDWMNGTVYDSDYWNATHIGIQLSEIGVGDANFYWDYAEISWHTTEWYSTSWRYRKSISVTGSAGAGSNYQIPLTVTYDSNMQSDFDDLRFTAYDGVTEWDYWIEEYTASTTATVWVEWRDNLDSNSMGYMYYGNDAVSTTSNGTNTFIFFDDFENNNLDRWTTKGSDWSTTAAQKKYGSYSGYVDSGGVNRELTKTLDAALTTSFMVHTHIRFQSVTGEEYGIHAYETDATSIYGLYSENNEWATYDGVDVKYYEQNTQTANTWFLFELGFDFVGGEFYPYLNSVLKTKQDLDSADASNIITDVKKIGSLGAVDLNCDHWIDDYYIRKWIVTEPSFSSFGAEEPLYPPAWNTVSTVGFLFHVAWDPAFQFGYDMFFITLGLIMIPVATMYLARGGRNEMSMNKLFYGLILLMVGFALLIGGITP